MHGKGCEKNETAATELYFAAAQQGHIKSQLIVAELYANGRGVKQDLVRAAHNYLEAAKQGDETAQFNLGIMYSEGRGVERSLESALEYFMQSASQGYARAQHAVGHMHLHGMGGLPKSDEQAFSFFLQAAEQVSGMFSRSLQNSSKSFDDPSSTALFFARALDAGRFEIAISSRYHVR